MINNCTQTRFKTTYGPDATNRRILSIARNIFFIFLKSAQTRENTGSLQASG